MLYRCSCYMYVLDFQDVDCGDPGVPKHGKKWVGSTFLGSVVKYTCHKGWVLVGRALRVCRGDGRWSGTLPYCKGNACMMLFCACVYVRLSDQSDSTNQI